jgi:hypothetical protein
MHDLAFAAMRVDPGFAKYTELMRPILVRSGLLTDDPTRFDLDHTAAAMERYNESVRACVPPDRLLEWSPADGWEPLCEFVGAPVPAMPLPRTNDAKTFSDRIFDMCMARLNDWYDQRTRPAEPAH